jgi:dTMP kinase
MRFAKLILFGYNLYSLKNGGLLGFFITFEGIEGCGKTTQISHLTAYLEEKHIPHLLTREPGGTAIGDRIRQILLSSENSRMEAVTEFFLYVAARAQHISQVVLPALKDGKTVLCDRFADATIAYQGYGRDLNREWIEEIHRRFLRDLKPDLTFLLDLPVEEGLRRAWKRMENQAVKEDRFEKEALAFHQRVREGYLLLARREPQRIIVLDGRKDEKFLHQEIVNYLPKDL